MQRKFSQCPLSLSQVDISYIIKGAWQVSTTFETIKERTGLSDAEVIRLKYRELQSSPFRLWLKRMKERTTKHRHLSRPAMKFNDLKVADDGRVNG